MGKHRQLPHWPTWGDKVLRRARERQGLTREALADATGLVAATIRNIERGRIKTPEPLTLRLLCAALTLPVPGDEGLYLTLDGIQADRLLAVTASALGEFALRRRDAARFAAAVCPQIPVKNIQHERDLALRLLDLLRLGVSAPPLLTNPSRQSPSRRRTG